MEGLKTKKSKIGVVSSDAMDKSATIVVSRTVLDNRFKKYVRRKKKFMAHDEANECKKGDTVLIRESRPLSKRKRWVVEKILEKATI